jgi:serine/threonine protein kinase
MSPEQALGAEIDVRSDLYSLGVTLYQLLTGSLPFDATETRALLYKHVTEPAPPLPITVPPSLQAIVMRLLAKTPDRRYASTTEAIAALQEVVFELRTDPTPWVRLLDDDAESAPRMTRDRPSAQSRNGSADLGATQLAIPPIDATPTIASTPESTLENPDLRAVDEVLRNILSMDLGAARRALDEGIRVPGLEVEREPKPQPTSTPPRGSMQ